MPMMPTPQAIAPPLVRYGDHASLASLLRGALTRGNAGVSRAALLHALTAMESRSRSVVPDAMLFQLLSQTVADLLLPGNEAKLQSILRYHAIASQVQARHKANALTRAFPKAQQPARRSMPPTLAMFT